MNIHAWILHLSKNADEQGRFRIRRLKPFMHAVSGRKCVRRIGFPRRAAGFPALRGGSDEGAECFLIFA